MDKNIICIGTEHNGYSIDLEKHLLIIHQLNSLYENLVQKKEKNMTIKLNEIKHVDVLYCEYDAGLFGENCNVVFKVYLNDGSTYDFHKNIEASKYDLLKAYSILKNEGIVFHDKYNILETIADSPIEHVSSILVDMIKNNKLPKIDRLSK